MAERVPDAIRSGLSGSNAGQDVANSNGAEMTATTGAYRASLPYLISSSSPPGTTKDPSFAQIRQPKRKRRPARHAGIRRPDDSPPRQSASASSWGAADLSDDGGDTTSSEELEGNDATSPAVSPTSERIHSGLDEPPAALPPRKRRHLGADDVGRFASMSIDQQQYSVNARSAPTTTQRPSEITMPPSPAVPPVSMNDDDLTEAVYEDVMATNIEEPLDDDIDMRARRGPSTIQMDKDRFFVTSLSDSEDDDDDDVKESEQEGIDRAMRRAAAHPDAVRMATAEKADTSQGPALIINGELVTRLQAMEWERKMALARDKAATSLLPERRGSGSGTSTPLRKDGSSSPSPQSALILWRQPDNTSLNFGATSIPSVEPQAPPPVVLEDGQYAYVQRHHRPQTDGCGDDHKLSTNVFMDMDIDDD